jgi:hypothetical protein
MREINNIDSHLIALRYRYGELLSLAEVATVFKYKNVFSARRAFSRGNFPVPLYRFPSKQGWYAKTIEVAQCIDRLDAQNTPTTSTKRTAL